MKNSLKTPNLFDVILGRSPSCKQRIQDAKQRFAHAILKLDIATHFVDMTTAKIEPQRAAPKRVKP